MRKIVSGLFVSLDGVAESPKDWRLPFDAETAESIGKGLADTDTILLGRNTYLEFADFWPKMGSDVPMSDFLNNTPKYVASTTLDEPLSWQNSTLIKGDLNERLTELKQRPGKNILVPGSPRLVCALLRDGLLDQLSLMIQPVVVGSGMRLFEEIKRFVRLDVVDSAIMSSGVISVTYVPAAEES